MGRNEADAAQEIRGQERGHTGRDKGLRGKADNISASWRSVVPVTDRETLTSYFFTCKSTDFHIFFRIAFLFSLFSLDAYSARVSALTDES